MSSDAVAADASTGPELLRQLALDLCWSWSHATDELWRRLEPELWSKTRNP
jgi:glycogen phosphorylase